MRITFNIEEDLLEDVKRYASERQVSLDKATSDLLRRGLHVPPLTRIANGLHLAVLPPDSPEVTHEDVRRILDEME